MTELDIDVFELLGRLGIDKIHPASGGAEAQFSCPFHADERPSAYMNVDTGASYCHSCHQSFSTPVGFVAAIEGVPYAVAAGWLREAYGFDFREPEGGSMAAETHHRFAPPAATPELSRPNRSWLETFRSDLYVDAGTRAYEYIRGRGLLPGTIARWKLGYDVISGRLTIPIWDLAGELVGFKGRALEDEVEPKYLILGDRATPRYGFQPYEASQVVFGLNRGEGGVGVLCEGELNAVALDQIGVDRPLALGMSYLSEAHASLILRVCHELVAFFDTDESGINGVWSRGVVDKLERQIKVRVVEPHQGDPASMVERGEQRRALDLIDRATGSVALQTTSR